MEEQLWNIRRYQVEDAKDLFMMMEKEADWSGYTSGTGKRKYLHVLQTSLTYLLLENEKICGYARCREDDGFGVYIYDLLVDATYRGKSYGRYLMEQVCHDFPEQTVYVMSDVDPYYEKQGYQKEGTIFIVQPNKK
ncbi:GNAT family N-acetyltransferase [Enterococcus devriesei]|uniref:GNAT family N-acetyltransferase n=1 Tax=Enterococcus devriesei TaxID=319970 RepID=UPI0028AAA005|nr:GNAT family N-acetyltransferase [Enterococcus devriesei]